MAHRSPPRACGQLSAVRRRFAEAAGLPFAGLLPADAVDRAVAAEGVRFRDRLFPPAVTLWVFLSQVLDAAHCRRQAVARFLASRLSYRLMAPCSAAAGGAARHTSACPRPCPPGWRGRWGASPRTRPRPPGAGTAARSSWSMARRPPCPTRPPTRGNIPSRGRRSPASASRWSAWSYCSRWPWGRRWTKRGPYRGKRTGESALFPGVARPAGGRRHVLLADRCYCSYFEMVRAASVAATPCSGCTSVGGWTSAAVGGWGGPTTW